jgi:hypothetical protein
MDRRVSSVGKRIVIDESCFEVCLGWMYKYESRATCSSSSACCGKDRGVHPLRRAASVTSRVHCNLIIIQNLNYFIRNKQLLLPQEYRLKR